MDHQTLVVTGGVDTHKATHVAAVVDPTGRLLATQSFPATPTGYTQMAAWMNSFGLVDRIGIEGTGSYGAGLARHFTNTGIRVVEVNRTNRQTRRAHGKNDTIDAVAAARAALSGQATTTPKTRDGIVESIRVIRIAFRSARDTRATIGIQIRDLIMCGPDELRVALEALTTSQQADKAARFRPGPITDPVEATRAALRSLARRYQTLTTEIGQLRTQLDQLTMQANPTLRAVHGVGIDVASILLIAAGDNPQRFTSDNAFAALCGAAPIEASSGNTTRHRLNRGGNRQANHALWRIALVRLSHDPRTKAYAQRRRTEGKTKKETVRCLKRHIAREIYHVLTNPNPATIPNTSDLRPTRQQAGITLTTAAKALGTYPARLSDLERGTRHNPTLEHTYRTWLTNQTAA